jgi:hypothetical protein
MTDNVVHLADHVVRHILAAAEPRPALHYRPADFCYWLATKIAATGAYRLGSDGMAAPQKLQQISHIRNRMVRVGTVRLLPAEMPPARAGIERRPLVVADPEQGSDAAAVRHHKPPVCSIGRRKDCA